MTEPRKCKNCDYLRERSCEAETGLWCAVTSRNVAVGHTCHCEPVLRARLLREWGAEFVPGDTAWWIHRPFQGFTTGVKVLEAKVVEVLIGERVRYKCKHADELVPNVTTSDLYPTRELAEAAAKGEADERG